MKHGQSAAGILLASSFLVAGHAQTQSAGRRPDSLQKSAAPSLTSLTIVTPKINVANSKSVPAMQVGVSAPGGIAICEFQLTSPAGVIYSLDGCLEPPGVLSGKFYASSGPLLSGVSEAEAPNQVFVMNQPSHYLQAGTCPSIGRGRHPDDRCHEAKRLRQDFGQGDG